MSEQPRYTLAEAKLLLEQQKCARNGHDYQITLATGSDKPHAVSCFRCGKSWDVVAREKAQR